MLHAKLRLRRRSEPLIVEKSLKLVIRAVFTDSILNYLAKISNWGWLVSFREFFVKLIPCSICHRSHLRSWWQDHRRWLSRPQLDIISKDWRLRRQKRIPLFLISKK